MPVPFVLNSLEQISFNENDSPEQLQRIQPEPLNLVGLDLTFIEQIEQFAQEHPGIIPPYVLENIEEARAAAIERSNQMEQNPNLDPDEFTENPENRPRIVTPILPSTITPPAPSAPLPPQPIPGGYDDYEYSPPPTVNNVIINTDPTDTSNLTNDSVVKVTLSTSTDGANIYYTLDGTTPTNNSTLYEGTFTVTASGITAETITIKAIGMRSSFNNSPIATKVITFAEAEPVIISPSEVDIIVFMENGLNRSVTRKFACFDLFPRSENQATSERCFLW